jgi:hypothetical protein
MIRTLSIIGSSILLVIILGLSVYGVMTPYYQPLSKVGIFQLAPFENGLTFFQGSRGQFFTVSPSNDYITTADGTRSALFDIEESDKKLYSSSLQKNQLQKLALTIQNAISPAAPFIQYSPQSGKYTISYEAEVVDNSAIITRTLTADKSPLPTGKSGITLSFRETSFVYAPNGTLYTFQDVETAAFFNREYQVSLRSAGNVMRPEVDQGAVLITNSYTTGTLLVIASPGQTLYVDRDTKKIEIEESLASTTSHSSSIKVQVYETPAQALQAFSNLQQTL